MSARSRTTLGGWRVRLAPWALVVWLAAAMAPRASLVVHHHDGDDHPHVHPFGATPDAHDDGHPGHHHPHHLHAPDAPHVAAALEEPDLTHGDHAHWQEPFHRVSAAALAPFGRTECVRRVAPARPCRLPCLRDVSASARAPPSPPTALDS